MRKTSKSEKWQNEQVVTIENHIKVENYHIAGYIDKPSKGDLDHFSTSFPEVTH